MKFFPLVFTLFMFILFANLFGMIPYFFTVTSHIIVTVALSMLVFAVVIVYGFVQERPEVPQAVRAVRASPATSFPGAPIEFISFLSRPITLSVRLFGNILAGHIMLKVFGGMVVALLSPASGLRSRSAVHHGRCADWPRISRRCLQAFVFAVLTCVYLNDAIHPSTSHRSGGLFRQTQLSRLKGLKNGS